MKRLIRIYLLFVAALLMLGIALVSWLQSSSTAGALRKLGRSQAEFLEARTQLLLGTSNPTRDLLKLAATRTRPLAARLQAYSLLEELLGRQPEALDSATIAAALADTATPLRLAVLKMLERAGAANGLFAVAEIMRSTRDTTLFQQSFRTLKVAEYGIANVLTNPASVDSARLDSVAAVLRRVPVGKGKGYPALAAYYSSRGDFARAEAFSGRIDVVNKWWAVGSWDNHQMSAFLKALGPETRPFNPRDTFQTAPGETAHWIPVDRLTALFSDQWVDLQNLFVKNLYAAAFLFTYVHVPTDREALVFFGSDDGACVYVNDSLVYTHKVFRATQVDDDVVKVRLHAGANRLMVKVLQDVGGWGLTCRIADLSGEMMPDLFVSLSDTATAGSPADWARAMARADTGWERILTECSAGNPGLASALIAIVNDSVVEGDTRLRALRAVEFVNQHRLAPAGEDALAALAGRALAAGDEGPLTAEALKALAAAGSRRCLDLGVRARASHDALMQYCGNRLVSFVCKDRLVRLGKLDDQQRRAEIDKTVGDVRALRPTDPWVMERLAAFDELRGDSAGALELRSSIAMPRRWLLYLFSDLHAGAAALLSSVIRIPLPQKFDSPPKLDKQFDPAGLEVDTLRGGFPSSFFVFSGASPCPGDRQIAALSTTVTSDRDDSAYLAVTLPAPFSVLFNGVEAGRNNESLDLSCYDLQARYPAQPFNYDAMVFPVRVRKGANTVCIAVSPFCYQMSAMFFRCGFIDKYGKPVGCRDLTLGWR